MFPADERVRTTTDCGGAQVGYLHKPTCPVSALRTAVLLLLLRCAVLCCTVLWQVKRVVGDASSRFRHWFV